MFHNIKTQTSPIYVYMHIYVCLCYVHQFYLFQFFVSQNLFQFVCLTWWLNTTLPRSLSCLCEWHHSFWILARILTFIQSEIFHFSSLFNRSRMLIGRHHSQPTDQIFIFLFFLTHLFFFCVDDSTWWVSCPSECCDLTRSISKINSTLLFSATEVNVMSSL